jgi:hypothetical protein
LCFIYFPHLCHKSTTPQRPCFKHLNNI